VVEASITTQRRSDGGVVVVVRGELDMASADSLRAVLVDAAATWRPPIIIVELLYVTLVDSSGIGALVAGYNAATRVGVGFKVSNANALVHQQLRVTGLIEVLGAGPAPTAQPYADDGDRPR
jgi:anti-anti-sigma factor